MHSAKSPLDLLQAAFRTVLPTCRDATRLRSEALDGNIGFQQRLGLRLHLLVCRWCRRYGRQIRFLREAVRDHPEGLGDATPQTLSAEARERIKRALNQAE